MNPLRGLIAGGVRNPVLVNLLMVCILVGAVISTRRMAREAFPQFAVDHITVETAYPGASAEDVERSICRPIEEEIRGISGIRRISSSAHENFGIVEIALFYGVDDPSKVLDEIKQRVDQITTFPKDAEKPVAQIPVLRSPVISVAIFGDAPERTLKRYAQEVSDDLTSFPEISQVVLSGVRDDEIIIEVDENALLAYGLSLSRVLEVVRQSSLDLPAGVIRTGAEEVTLRVSGQRFTAVEYEDLSVIENQDAVVHLGDIATVREGFEESERRGRFNGQPAAVVSVYKTPDEDTSRIASQVRTYVADRTKTLPGRLGMAVWGDTSRQVDAMLGMLLKNGVVGICLVFATLLVFLRLRHAVWVAIGIPVAFAGALIIIRAYGGNINIVSLFALLMVSGIIVDDAIVIAESIHSRRRAGDGPELASTNGASHVALPVLGASLTTIIAFVPLLYVVGVMGRFVHILPIVVIAAVISSAVEAFFMLPSHLCERRAVGLKAVEKKPHALRIAIERATDRVITHWYRPVYRWALAHRTLVLCSGLAALLTVGGLVFGGRTPIILMPKDDANILRARLRFPDGSPTIATERAIQRLEEAARALNHDPEVRPAADGDLVRQIYSIKGEFTEFWPTRGGSLCEVRIELMPAEQRRVDAGKLIEQWRQHIGSIPEATVFTIERQHLGPTARPIEIRLMADRIDDLADASQRIQQKLREFDGVTDVHDDLIPGKRELHVSLQPTARSLGITTADIARHLRNGFFGGEAVTLQRGRDQVKVRVRYPAETRRSIGDLENERITTPQGDDVPFLEVADVEWVNSYAVIRHQEGKRRIRVRANLDEARANAEQILGELEGGFLSGVTRDYAGMRFEFGGDRQYMDESLDSLFDGFVIAVVAIYAVLASMLRSYVQPIVILIALPLGMIGVVVGHLMLGYDLTMMSLFGVVALAGVVVNDSLVLIDAINRSLREGKGVDEAVAAAGEARFRAVVLTSATTVMALLPLLLERSSYAFAVIPMAISLSFGILFATVLTLLVVPATFLLVNDAHRWLRWVFRGGSYPSPEAVERASHERMLATE